MKARVKKMFQHEGKQHHPGEEVELKQDKYDELNKSGHVEDASKQPEHQPPQGGFQTPEAGQVSPGSPGSSGSGSSGSSGSQSSQGQGSQGSKKT